MGNDCTCSPIRVLGLQGIVFYSKLRKKVYSSISSYLHYDFFFLSRAVRCICIKSSYCYGCVK